MTTRVIVADDHPIIQAGLRMALENETDISIVAEARSADELLTILRKTRAIWSSPIS